MQLREIPVEQQTAPDRPSFRHHGDADERIEQIDELHHHLPPDHDLERRERAY
jgi:hypothetical protein